MKKCVKCRVEQDNSMFTKNKNTKDGLCPTCKICAKIYRLENRQYMIQYRKENKEAIAQITKQYKTVNKENIIAYKKQYSKENKAAIAEYNKQYREKHKDHIALSKKKYETKHRKRLNVIKNEYSKNRRKNEPNYKLRTNISNNIKNQLHKRASSKEGNSCLKYLPYTINELRKHLEKKFEPWMTWNNYGMYNSAIWDDNNQYTWTWQVDHIIPQASLSYTSMADDNFKKCWELSNLRPYSGKQNCLDGANGVRHI
jgi:hypothetical protein